MPAQKCPEFVFQDGAPVPFSLTIFPTGKRNPRPAEARRLAAAHLAELGKDVRILGVEGNYVFYAPRGEKRGKR